MRDTPLILIADDEAGYQEIIGTKLKRSGYLVAEAHDGKEAVEKAAKLKPDLILMDINMPGESGTEAVLDLMRDPATMGLKIVFLTTMSDPWPAIKAKNPDFAKELGAAAFINKADDLDLVTDKIREFLPPATRI